jgi:hypothetical protein
LQAEKGSSRGARAITCACAWQTQRLAQSERAGATDAVTTRYCKGASAGDSAPDSLVRFDRSVRVDDEGRFGHGGPRSGAAAIVRVVTKITPADGRQPERTDISGVSVCNGLNQWRSAINYL